MNDTNSYTQKIAADWVSSKYYDIAEKSNPFWDDNFIFFQLFRKLDLTKIVEIACGHGRHVIHYVNIAPSITLVDINKENIEFCKNRFSEFDKIEYIVNDGTHLTGISNGSATAVICYDSMVHFELLDIAIYLKEIYRILSVGGMALLHHSNYCGNPGAEYTKNPHLRNFMSHAIFKHLALRSNLTVLQQNILNWGSGDEFYSSIDCLTLLAR